MGKLTGIGHWQKHFCVVDRVADGVPRFQSQMITFPQVQMVDLDAGCAGRCYFSRVAFKRGKKHISISIELKQAAGGRVWKWDLLTSSHPANRERRFRRWNCLRWDSDQVMATSGQGLISPPSDCWSLQNCPERRLENYRELRSHTKRESYHKHISPRLFFIQKINK